LKYWKIAPGEQGFLWVEQRDHRCIAIGWSETGDLRKCKTEEAIRRRFHDIDWGFRRKPTQLIKFYKSVKPGHKVLANSGKWIYGLGTVSGNYRYYKDLYYRHGKPVRWELRFWEPLNIEEHDFPEELVNRIRLNRTIMKLQEEEWKLIEKQVLAIRNPFEGLTSFEGICRAPETEQEVIILFSKLSQHLKMRIEGVSTRFPDALVRVKKGKSWVTKAAEFEVYSSNFKAHGHLDKMKAGRDCDYVICWKDDWKPSSGLVEIVELRKELEEIV